MMLSQRPFRLEREMLDPLARALGSVIGPLPLDRVSVVREPPIGSIIPDLLIGIWPAHRPLVERPHCTMIEAHIVAGLEGGLRLAPIELADLLHLPEQVATRAIRRLSRLGVLEAAPDGSLFLRTQFSTQDLQVVAVEAKMRRWRGALSQAIHYKTFADRVYVVLDGNQVQTNLPMLHAFREAGVGLLFQHEFALTTVVAAVDARPQSAMRVRAADRLFGRVAAPRSVSRPEMSSDAGAPTPSIEGC